MKHFKKVLGLLIEGAMAVLAAVGLTIICAHYFDISEVQAGAILGGSVVLFGYWLDVEL
jgi:hypothetical protein